MRGQDSGSASGTCSSQAAMGVVNFNSTPSSSSLNRGGFVSSRTQVSPSLVQFQQICSNFTRPRRPRFQKSNSFFVIRAYIENPNSIAGIANKVIGSLPLIGLVARIFSDEGGVGGDIIDFAEFRRRVGKKCTITDSRAFYEFQDRRGKPGDPLYVLLCCWVAAVGAGLLKSEEIFEGAFRLRISNDIEFEEQNFVALMSEAKKRRAKLNAAVPTIPMEIRVEKALEAIYVCCFANEAVEEEDERLLNIMLSAVFPSVDRPEIERLVRQKAARVAEGNDEGYISAQKPLSKEAVQMQMKDLQFLQQDKYT